MDGEVTMEATTFPVTRNLGGSESDRSDAGSIGLHGSSVAEQSSLLGILAVTGSWMPVLVAGGGGFLILNSAL